MTYRLFYSLLVIFVTANLSLFSVNGHAQSGDQTALIEALQSGGYVVYMRHADTTGEPLDRTRDLTNRAQQRNLSAAGRIQAAAIGDAIRRLELKVGHVAASPVFRARDTAELAFGADQIEIDPWLIADDYVAGGYTEYVSMLHQYLATLPKDGNTWLIGHVIPITMVTSSQVSRSNFPEGAAAVFLPEGGNYKLIGILGSGWEAMQ